MVPLLSKLHQVLLMFREDVMLALLFLKITGGSSNCLISEDNMMLFQFCSCSHKSEKAFGKNYLPFRSNANKSSRKQLYSDICLKTLKQEAQTVIQLLKHSSYWVDIESKFGGDSAYIAFH